MMKSTVSLIGSLNARDTEYRYLLLDPLKNVAIWDPLHTAQLNENFNKDDLRRVLRPDLAWSLEHCPILLLLAAPGEQCDELLVNSSQDYAIGEVLSEKRYVCGWLSSSLNLDEMSAWLADLCRNIKFNSVTPIFEPLRLELLQATASSELLSTHLAKISQWHLISSVGNLITLVGEKKNIELRLNWGAEQAQNNIRDIWRLLVAWKEILTPLPSNAVYCATTAWAEAEKSGLHKLNDKLYLALNNLTLPSSIANHPLVLEILQQAANDPELDFIQLFQNLPNSVWQNSDETEHG